jgi:hypothetical protein
VTPETLGQALVVVAAVIVQMAAGYFAARMLAAVMEVLP